MRFVILPLLLLFMIQSAYAEYDGIFRILDERYVENVADLPESKDLKPDKNIQRSGSIEGWIDIVGFRQMIREDGIDYVLGSPADYAIVQYDAQPKVCPRCVVESFKKSTSISTAEDQITASLEMQLIWFEWVSCGKNCARKKYHTETATFQDREHSPKIYPSLPEPQVIVTQYNNSLYENIGIRIFNDNYTKITFRYQDKQAVRTLKVLHVENTSKGIVYGNMTILDQWKTEGAGISRFYNEILMDGNLSKMDINEFDIQVYNPYTSRKADPENFTVQRIVLDPGKAFSALLVALLSSLGVLVVGSIYLVNSLRSRWQIRLF